MAAIRKFTVNVQYVKKENAFREIDVFAPEVTSEDDIRLMAEAQLLDGFREEYRERVELISTQIIHGKTITYHNGKL